MEADLARLRESGDGRRHFHATYLRTTVAVGEEIDRGGFADGAWLERGTVGGVEALAARPAARARQPGGHQADPHRGAGEGVEGRPGPRPRPPYRAGRVRCRAGRTGEAVRRPGGRPDRTRAGAAEAGPPRVRRPARDH